MMRLLATFAIWSVVCVLCLCWTEAVQQGFFFFFFFFVMFLFFARFGAPTIFLLLNQRRRLVDSMSHVFFSFAGVGCRGLCVQSSICDGLFGPKSKQNIFRACIKP